MHIKKIFFWFVKINAQGCQWRKLNEEELLTKCLDDLIQMNEMGEVYGVYGEQSCIQGFDREA
jgi:hypothetical protein